MQIIISKTKFSTSKHNKLWFYSLHRKNPAPLYNTICQLTATKYNNKEEQRRRYLQRTSESVSNTFKHIVSNMKSLSSSY